MANINFVKTNFRILYENGQDENGEPIYKTKSYNNINTACTDDQIQQAAIAISSLSKLPFYTIERDDKKEISAK